MADEPILKTPGELLAEAREGAGLSLATVSERTKIPVPQLQIIERDEYHRLSGPLYVKSFLRAYAEAVDLDVGMILDLYNRSNSEGAPGAGGGRAEVWESETVTITRVGVDWGRLLAWGAGGAVVVVGAWLLIRLLSGGGGRPATQPAAEPAARPPAAAVARDTVVTTSAPPTVTPAGGGDAAAAKPQDGGPQRPATRPPAEQQEAAPQPAAQKPAVQKPAVPEPAAQETSPAAAPSGPAAAEPGPAAATPPQDTTPATGGTELPAAYSGAGSIPFTDGTRWPVRVRLLTDAPLEAEAKCDGEQRFRPARFVPGGVGQPAQPARDIEPGRAYAVREGLVVYWHAQDHCVLRLDRTTGVQISVNGRVRDIGGLQPGQEIVLDNFR